MTQAQVQENNHSTEDSPDIPFDTDSLFEKKQTVLSELNSDESYVIKSLQDGKISDAYDGILDFSTEAGKNEFNFLQKVITKNNWLVIPSSLYKQYETDAISLKDLESSINTTHDKLGISKPNMNFVKTDKINNDFISNVSDVDSSPEVKNLTKDTNTKPTGIASGEAVSMKPSDILGNFDITVKHKINQLYYNKNKVEKTKGKVSIKSLLTAGGVFALGVVFTPLSAITVPAAIAIGGYAVLKGMFAKNPDLKNYDKQIDALQEATAKMVLKSNNEDTKENINNFIKHNKNLESTLFDEKIEAEFARICKTRNIKIDSNIFKTASKYQAGNVIDYNREVKKAKM